MQIIITNTMPNASALPRPGLCSASPLICALIRIVTRLPVPPVSARCLRGGGPVRPSAVMVPWFSRVTCVQFASGWLASTTTQEPPSSPARVPWEKSRS